MSEASLNQIVKGAPRPNTSKSIVTAAAVSKSSSIRSASELDEDKKPNLNHTDPLSLLPSSPPQTYLNLLILEASLRSQYLTLRARRRQHTFFLFLLFLWIVGTFYALFIRPREDGSGIGGSVYWVVDMGMKMAFMGGIFTAILIWGTGQWERGVRWPRRWVGITNRGLRGMNLKIVVLKGPWWRRLFAYLAFLFPYSSFFPSQGSSYHYVEYPEQRDSSRSSHMPRRSSMKEEDVAPGGDHIKLLLLPKQFSPEFRENWDLYRTEYWEKENERRAELRKIVKKRDRQLAKQQGGWLWWTGWRGWKRVNKTRDFGKSCDVEKIASGHHSRRGSMRDGRRRSPSLLQGASHSRSSSRSSFAAGSDIEDAQGGSVSGRSTRSGSKRSKTSSRTGAGKSSHRKRLSDLRDVTPEYDEKEEHGQIQSDLDRNHHTIPDLDKRASVVSNASSSGMSDGEMSERSTTSVASSRGLPIEGTTRARTRQLRDSLLIESD